MGYDAGAEYRAAFTATYQVRVTRTSGPPSKGVFGRLETDCNADSRSTCTLPVKGSRQGVGSTLFDQDSYKMVLTKGRSYTVTF